MKGSDDTGQDKTNDSETTEYPGIDDLVETYDIPSEKTSELPRPTPLALARSLR
jgi:hypothetical protein